MSARTRITPQTEYHKRESILLIGVLLSLLAITARLFYWQVVQAKSLQAAAEDQYQRTVTTAGSRGAIYTADGYPLVTNEPIYRLFAHPHILSERPAFIAQSLVDILAEQQAATGAAKVALEEELTAKLSKTDTKWVSLFQSVTEESKNKITELDIVGLGFDPYERRAYPEASMAAHITGFVGKDSEGVDVGYFGIEGALEKELQARSTTSTVLTDALGLQLFGNNSQLPRTLDGREVVTTIRRDVQFILEQYLEAGIEQYGATSGEVIVMEPSTGKILGMATFPNYDQAQFYKYEPELYKNPSVANVYEPGSTFKVLTVAAGIDAGVITPETTCPKCAGPRTFGKYTIRTWNDEYHPDITMEQALAKSDNTGMIFIAEQLGTDTFVSYLQKFGIGKALDIDLQEDTSTPFRDSWGPVELATTSFGQGVSVNSLQLVRAVGAIANQGKMMKPIIVDKVRDPLSGDTLVTPIQQEAEVVSPQTASTVTSMMITAAQAGEAQWTASKTHTIAGKTGTSQIAVEGGYAEDRTVASFIGFAPPKNPQFIMLVKLTEPSSSPWAAETAAPLWYKIADRLFLLFTIPPDRN